MDIEKPILLIDKERVLKNIERIGIKAKKNGVRFRPHFKTHQSAKVAEWFKDFTTTITVSSVDMAEYFASHGWKDITIAFPVNIRQIRAINKLAKKINLHLLVESKESIIFLKNNLKAKANVWIKIDVGSNRTGVLWNNFDYILELVQEIKTIEHLSFRGLLTHAGHTYKAKSKDEIEKIFRNTALQMKEVQNMLKQHGFTEVEISVGDTPSCAIVEDLNSVDEIRPGNFVFYDVMQLHIGSCSEEDIALALACPVVAKHKERNEIVVYGGAIHLSKEFIEPKNEPRLYGYIAVLEDNKWSPRIKNTYVSSLSQEHGLIKTDTDFFEKIQIGDILLVLPVHSCLTVNLMKNYEPKILL
ncbi:MAG: alanine racemase [Candidatus Hodarchaeota archaeon]